MTWPQDAYVGQKIVCIDGSATSRLFYVRNGGDVKVEYLHELAEGGIYTVSCVMPPSPMHGRSYIGVHVAEVDRPAEMPFHHKRFRPVENAARRTDAAVRKIISDALKAPTRARRTEHV